MKLSHIIKGAGFGMLVGLIFVGVMAIASQAGAVLPQHIWQLPVRYVYAGVDIGDFYEDGGSSYTTNPSGNVVASDVSTATLEASGNATVGGSLTVTGTTAASTLSTTGLASLNTAAVTGAITSLGGAAMPVTTARTANFNAFEFGTGAVGTAITFSPAFASGTPQCFCNDTGASQFCRITATNTTGTVTGTGTDAVNWFCFGIK